MSRFGPVHHVGVTVADLDRAVSFWARLLDASPRDRRVLEGPQLATMVGYPRIRIEV
ncbi:MAG: methylmalonyl-CoA/ethylmalonyl-CoA epimerase, partial [Actinomycetota bacterium]|nr:methylmalonyl-CoA/ethylmalonyl-CoA epimerase [Actinomycetota bacterium]